MEYTCLETKGVDHVPSKAKGSVQITVLYTFLEVTPTKFNLVKNVKDCLTLDHLIRCHGEDDIYSDPKLLIVQLTTEREDRRKETKNTEVFQGIHS